MIFMRKGKDFYNKKYKEVFQLNEKGFSIKDISEKTGLSYSAVYSWIKKNKKPEKSVLIEFKEFLEKKGPTPVAEIEENFPKHNDFYHISRKRDIGINRLRIKGMKVGKYSDWYYLDGQEDELKKRLNEMKEKYKEFKEKMRDVLIHQS